MAHFVYDPNTDGNPQDATPESVNWTTEDEIEFLNCMYRKRNLRGLRNYAKILPYRNYFGHGMFVNWENVALAVSNRIEVLEGNGFF